MTRGDSGEATVSTDGIDPSPQSCPACETTVPATVAYCPECERLQTEPVPSGDVTDSGHWADVLLLGLLAWLGLFVSLTLVPGTPALSAPFGPVLLVGTLGMALAGYFDMQTLRERTGWNPDTIPWLVGFTVWFVNIPVTALYLWRRKQALR